MTNIWTAGGGRVAILAPGPDDLFCVTTLGGRRVVVQPIFEYEQALAVAQAFVAQAPVPVTLKVLCLSAREAKAMGYLPEGTLPAESPAQDAEDRQFAVSTLWRVVRESNDAKVRGDALGLLRELGEVR